MVSIRPIHATSISATLPQWSISVHALVWDPSSVSKIPATWAHSRFGRPYPCGACGVHARKQGLGNIDSSNRFAPSKVTPDLIDQTLYNHGLTRIGTDGYRSLEPSSRMQ